MKAEGWPDWLTVEDRAALDRLSSLVQARITGNTEAAAKALMCQRQVQRLQHELARTEVEIPQWPDSVPPEAVRVLERIALAGDGRRDWGEVLRYIHFVRVSATDLERVEAGKSLPGEG